MVLIVAAHEPIPTQITDTVVDQISRIGGTFIVLAAIAAIMWRWFVKDRWVAAVQRALGGDDEVERRAASDQRTLDGVSVSGNKVMDHVTKEVDGLRVDMEDHLDRIESLERKIENGMGDRLARVEEHVEKLVEGVARLEGIVMMLREEKKNE